MLLEKINYYKIITFGLNLSSSFFLNQGPATRLLFRPQQRICYIEEVDNIILFDVSDARSKKTYFQYLKHLLHDSLVHVFF
jgi:hypothetical protein